ncbi:protein of unknown function [Magnetospirillum sp. XM-1]|nr:protein of unknown function [Magnetospirillum sp. XM-1]
MIVVAVPRNLGHRRATTFVGTQPMAKSGKTMEELAEALRATLRRMPDGPNAAIIRRQLERYDRALEEGRRIKEEPADHHATSASGRKSLGVTCPPVSRWMRIMVVQSGRSSPRTMRLTDASLRPISVANWRCDVCVSRRYVASFMTPYIT